MPATEKIEKLLDQALVAQWQHEDFETAFQLFSQINQIDPQMCNSYLAWLYEFGEGVPRNIEKAKYHYALAAENGHQYAGEHLVSLEGAQNNLIHSDVWHLREKTLALCDEGAGYLLKEYGKYNRFKGLQMLKTAAKMGSACACDLLAAAYRNPEKGELPNIKQSVYWALRGISGYEVISARRLANHYLRRKTPEVTEGYYWLKKGALLGDSDCMYSLGDMYYSATHIAQNDAAAQFWFNLALQAKYCDEDNANYMRYALTDIAQVKQQLSNEDKAKWDQTISALQQRYDTFQQDLAAEMEQIRQDESSVAQKLQDDERSRQLAAKDAAYQTDILRLRSEAENGNQSAMVQLADLCFEKCYLVAESPQNFAQFEQAVQSLAQLHNDGMLDLQDSHIAESVNLCYCRIGNAYWHGTFGASKDLDKAYNWFALSVKLDDADSKEKCAQINKQRGAK